MNLSFRTKLFLSYLILSALMIVTLYLFGGRLLESRLLEDNRQLLLNEAGLVAQRLVASPEEASLQGLAEEMGKVTRARISLIGRDGSVRADSGVSSEQVASLPNHRSRPEIQQAFTGTPGVAVRFSDTVGMKLLYVAIPYTRGTETGVVRLSLPLSTIVEANATMKRWVLTVSVLLFSAAALFSFVLSRLISRPLQAMADAAESLGDGEWQLRLPLLGGDEITHLGRVLNRMGERIEQQMLTLADQREKLDTILQSMGEGLVVLQPDGTILLANTSFLRSFSLSGSPAGRKLAEVCRNPDLLAIHAEQRAVGQELFRELHLPMPGITFLTHWVPLGQQEGTVAVFHDISEIKRLETVRQDFVANVSHELRTPVTVIKGYAETLLNGVLHDDPATAHTFVTTIHDHAERLSNLIRDLLSLSKIEASAERPTMVPLDLHEVVAPVSTLLAGKAAAKELTVEINIADGFPAIAGNRHYLEQVLFNLLDNAIAYTPAGGRVTITASRDQERIRIDVADTGMGISPEHLPRIFERFYRVDPSRSREQGGTGLGLAIVKHIVQMHGGEISVQSAPGKGSTFTVALPASA